MRLVVNALYIEDKKVLLVRKKDTWIFPGGKPEEGESDAECLYRECCDEELPGSRIEIIKYEGCYMGKTPHTGDIVIARLYVCRLSGDLTSSAELSASRFFTYDEAMQENISEITRQMIVSLKQNGYVV